MKEKTNKQNQSGSEENTDHNEPGFAKLEIKLRSKTLKILMINLLLIYRKKIDFG